MSFSSRTMQENDWESLKYFKKSEFAYPENMGYEFMMWLDRLRDIAGVQMNVSSSFRTPEHNQRVKGASNSAHCLIPCEAVDIRKHIKDNDKHWNYARFRIVKIALEMGCRRLGIYLNGSLHIDRSEQHPNDRIWIQV